MSRPSLAAGGADATEVLVPDMKSLWPLRPTCSRAEQCLLFGLRAMGAWPHHQHDAVAALTTLGITPNGIIALAQLRTVLASNGPALRFLEAGAPFVGLDELDLLCCLNRLARSDALASLLRTRPDERDKLLLMALQQAAHVLRDAGVRLRQRTPDGSGRRLLEQDALAADARRAASMRLRTVRVSRVQQLSPALRRITLSGAALDGYLADCPAQWLKLYAPMSLGDLGDIGRAYTIRHYRPAQREVDIDVVLHDSGPLSRWAASAWSGQVLRMSDARGGYPVPAAAPWLLLAGDAVALPAIATIIEALPAGTVLKVCLEVGHESDLDSLPAGRPFELHWALRRPRVRLVQSSLLALVEAATLPAGAGQVWLAGEATLTRSIRKHLLAGRALVAPQVHSVAYWKRGERDHADMAAG